MKNLLNGESVIYKTKVHIFYKTIYIFVLIAFLVLTIWIINLNFLKMVKTLLILYSVISVGILAYIAAQVFSIKVYITEDRFIYKKGFLLQKVLDIELSKIDSIQVSRGLIGLFVKVGNIKVSWGGGQITRIRYIINPAELRNVIHKQKQ